MMEEVVICDGDILTSLGDLSSTWKKMLAGECGLSRKNKALEEKGSFKYRGNLDYPLGLIAGLKGQGGSWRRMQSLLDCLLVDLPDLDKNTSLFLATTKASVDELLVPNGLLEGQPWQLAEYLKDRLQLQGQATTVSGACASGTLAIIQAGIAIATGVCDNALVIGVDLVGDFILTGFDSLKALSTNIAKPFDQHRDGLSLGDGGGWLLLSSARAAKKRSAKSMARLESWGTACDATHITAPCRYASGLRLALDQLFANTSVVGEVGGINGHGTGTIYNDSMELLAFGEKCSGSPICSVKGAIGHTLGAAGVIEALLSVQSLRDMVLPPTVGLEEVEGGGGNLSGQRALPLLAPSIISSNSGFGGINSAVLLCR